MDNGVQNLIPVIKRNLTPDDNLRNNQAESYMLVDQKGNPRKVIDFSNICLDLYIEKCAFEDKSFQRQIILNPVSHN